ncbi:MAG: hypothetical protein JHC73_16260 [Dolichospermum sp.]|nr:hypothetical protein [Dolichospermum sp.]
MLVSARIVNPDPISGFITVVLDGERHSINAGNGLFSKALEAYKVNDWDTFVGCVNPEIRLKSLYASYEGIEVKDGNLYVFGDAVHSTLATRVLSFLEAGLDCVYLFKFILKLNLNPSKRAVDELYTFLEHRVLPITDNGNFLAYKAVREDYTDKHSGKFLNTVDSVLEMPRNKVDDDKNVGCSYGFHAGTVEYAKEFMGYQGHLMLVEINPADVVSIPTDCQFQKLRTCRYKVVSEYEVDLTDPLYASRFETDQDDDVDLWDDDSDNDVCCDCLEESYGNCDNCDCCEGCCNCSEDDESDEDDDENDVKDLSWITPKTEVQLTLDLDNKMHSVDWTKQTVNLIKLVGHLFSTRRPALAMSLRREVDNYDDRTRIPFEVLLHHTTQDDVKRIYNELNP